MRISQLREDFLVGGIIIKRYGCFHAILYRGGRSSPIADKIIVEVHLARTERRIFKQGPSKVRVINTLHRRLFAGRGAALQGVGNIGANLQAEFILQQLF